MPAPPHARAVDWRRRLSRSLTVSGRDWPAPRRRAAIVAATVVAVIAVPLVGLTFSPSDAYVYLAAGERLNAGHQLYAILPGDRIIGVNPPFWTVPTLSPPLLAVLWRPLAAFGIAGMFAGWALAGAAYLIVVALATAKQPLVGLIATIALVFPIGWQLGLGNVNGFLTLGIAFAWAVRERAPLIGGVLALLVAVKVTPLALLIWLLATRRFRAIVWFSLTSLALAAVGIAGAGLDAYVTYFHVMLQTTASGTSNFSLAGVLRIVGVPADLARLAPWAALGVGAVAVAMLRRRPAFAFFTAVSLIIIASPVVQVYWFAILIGPLATMDLHQGEMGSEAIDSGAAPA